MELEDEADALFCHHLELEDRASDFEPGHVESEPKSYGSDMCAHLPTQSQDYTATIDTGCERTAVGIETLRTMMKHWPAELKWFKQPESNRFRSVHGISQTKYNAIVLCSLGKKGCYLKPAVFEGDHSKHAPFLISLKFLRHCRAVLHLDSAEPYILLTRTHVRVPVHFGLPGA